MTPTFSVSFLVRLRTIFLGLCLWRLCVMATGARADEIDDLIKSEMERQQIAGLSLAVVRDGKVIKAQGYGLANVETETPAKPETVYKIASVSKQFFAAGILILAQDGKLGLDDKVSKYLDGTPETWKDITIRHLLTHTSGIVREAPGFSPFKVQPDADVIKTAYPLPLQFAPGEKWQYCNVGYFALAEIVHKVSGKSWGEFFAERVFAPAGMSATRPTTTVDIVPHRAAGYVQKSGKRQNAENYPSLRPSGAFLSTVLDLAKWDAVLSSGKILTADSRQQLRTPVKLNNGTVHPYGLGWAVEDWQGHKRIGHSGGLPGFSSIFVRFPDDKLTVIILTNADGRSLLDASSRVAGFYVPALAPEADKTADGKTPK
jgi:D-alanyl-D-alanine carboxypeptidase